MPTLFIYKVLHHNFTSRILVLAIPYMYEFENFQTRKIVEFCCGIKIKHEYIYYLIRWGVAWRIATWQPLLSSLSPPKFQTITMNERKKQPLNKMFRRIHHKIYHDLMNNTVAKQKTFFLLQIFYTQMWNAWSGYIVIVVVWRKSHGVFVWIVTIHTLIKFKMKWID